MIRNIKELETEHMQNDLFMDDMNSENWYDIQLGSMNMKWKKAPESLVSFLEDKTKDIECEHRKMFGYPCYFINGNMFMGAHEENLILRLSQRDKKRALENPNVHEFEPMGRAMKEYVALHEDVYTDDKIFPNLLRDSIKYTGSLPPKKKKRKK